MSDPVIDQFLDERERRERAEAGAGEVMEQARAVYAPAALPAEPAPSPSPRPPIPDWLLALLGTPDRWVTYPLWAFWVFAIHAALLLLACGGLLFSAALLALVLSPLLGVRVALVLAAPAAALATAGTFVSVYRSFRTKLSQFPW